MVSRPCVFGYDVVFVGRAIGTCITHEPVVYSGSRHKRAKHAMAQQIFTVTIEKQRTVLTLLI